MAKQIDQVADGIYRIGEFWSEYGITINQFLIADEQISPKDCQLYFVKSGEESAVLESLEVDEFGRIKNWPERFFGDAIGEELEDRPRERSERRKADVLFLRKDPGRERDAVGAT